MRIAFPTSHQTSNRPFELSILTIASEQRPERAAYVLALLHSREWITLESEFLSASEAEAQTALEKIYKIEEFVSKKVLRFMA